MSNNKTAEEIACEKYNIKEGLNDYDENYYNSTNVNLAKAYIQGYNSRQSEIDQLNKEVEKLKEVIKTYEDGANIMEKEVERLRDGIKEVLETFEGKGVVNHNWLTNYLNKLINQ